MKKIICLLVLLLLAGCAEKECIEWEGSYSLNALELECFRYNLFNYLNQSDTWCWMQHEDNVITLEIHNDTGVMEFFIYEDCSKFVKIWGDDAT